MNFDREKRMTNKPAPTEVAIHELIAGRWSPRAYSSEPVSRDQLHAVLEAARWAPSAYNVQPWRFVVFDRGVDEVSFKQAFATLVPFNQGWNAPAPVLIAVTTHTLNNKGEVNRTAQYDAGAAAMSLVAGACARSRRASDERFRSERVPHGIQAARRRRSARDDLDWSLRRYRQARPGLREREKSVRQRLPLADIAYSGGWKKPY